VALAPAAVLASGAANGENLSVAVSESNALSDLVILITIAILTFKVIKLKLITPITTTIAAREN